MTVVAWVAETKIRADTFEWGKSYGGIVSKKSV